MNLNFNSRLGNSGRIGKLPSALFKKTKRLQMKNIIVLLGFSVVIISFSFRQTADDVVKALKTADTDQITAYFDNMIDMKLPDNVNEIKDINKNQAGIKLKSFFSENSINGFDLTSKKEMGSLMAITGKLNSSKKDYNLTLMLKEKGGKHYIITLRVS